jgi:putative ABC transport system permease protein
MGLKDLWSLVLETVRTQPLRSILTMLGIVIGMASIVLLSAIGEGTRRGVAAQFGQFGTNVIGVQPGKQKTFGTGPGAVGGTTHPLTVEDGDALRRVPGAAYVAPHVVGMGQVEIGARSRFTYVYGTVRDDQFILKWPARIGSFLPAGDVDQIPPVCVLGALVSRELFPETNPLGARVRIGESRLTVIGVMEPKGQVLGFDLDDMVILPVRRAMKMFNRDRVDEIHVLAGGHEGVDRLMASIRDVLMDRHDGEEDFTVISQTDMLRLIDEVMNVLTLGVLVIAGISLFVGAMGILTILWVSVHERTSEIGLAMAIGASRRQILCLFLGEAGLLSMIGGLAGLAVGVILGSLIRAAFPALWIEFPFWVFAAGMGVSLGIGVLSGVVPAARAARLDPIEALRAE